MFSLPQLEAFVAVAEELHFGAAAERLNMTQPPLSRQIQMLEKKLGTQLFGRTSRKVELTAAGATLLPRARQILDMCIKTDLDVRRVSSGQAGTITVGYTAIAGQSALPLMLRSPPKGCRECPLCSGNWCQRTRWTGWSRAVWTLACCGPSWPGPGWCAGR